MLRKRLNGEKSALLRCETDLGSTGENASGTRIGIELHVSVNTIVRSRQIMKSMALQSLNRTASGI